MKVVWLGRETQRSLTTTQVPGSILVGKTNSVFDLAAHTNGRVFTVGDLNFGVEGGGSGLENHAYPWLGGDIFGCAPEPPTPPVATTEVTPVAPTDPENPSTPGGGTDSGNEENPGNGGNGGTDGNGGDNLAQTGANVAWGVTAAGVLVAVGGALVMGNRRRKA